jgi:hypothetical protein
VPVEIVAAHAKRHIHIDGIKVYMEEGFSTIWGPIIARFGVINSLLTKIALCVALRSPAEQAGEEPCDNVQERPNSRKRW